MYYRRFPLLAIYPIAVYLTCQAKSGQNLWAFSSHNRRTEAEKQKRGGFGNLPKDSMGIARTISRIADDVAAAVDSLSRRTNKSVRQELMQIDIVGC